MDMGMDVEPGVPSVQHLQKSDFSLYPFLRGSKRAKRIGDGIHKRGVEHPLIPSGQVTQLRRRGEYKMVIADAGEPRFLPFNPGSGAAVIALGASPVPARSILLFHYAARVAYRFQYAVGLGPAFFKIEQCLKMPGEHAIPVFSDVFGAKARKNLAQPVHGGKGKNKEYSRRALDLNNGMRRSPAAFPPKS